MRSVGICLLVEFCLGFGVAGLFWPDKFIAIFEVLMFPWAASDRMVRAHGIAAIIFSALLVAQFFVQ